MKIVLIRRFGCASFISTDDAVLIATGILHFIVLMEA